MPTLSFFVTFTQICHSLGSLFANSSNFTRFITMKFAALTFLTAAIANLPSSSAVFTAGDNLSPSFGEQEASLSVAEKYFSWTYSAELKGASGDISAPECIAVFGAAFVEAYNEVHVGADVQAESCSVTSVGDGPLQNDTPPLTTTGGNYYYGSGDYS